MFSYLSPCSPLKHLFFLGVWPPALFEDFSYLVIFFSVRESKTYVTETQENKTDKDEQKSTGGVIFIYWFFG